MKKLEEFRVRAEKATEGPWFRDSTTFEGTTTENVTARLMDVACCSGGDTHPDHGRTEQAKDDAEFIAHSRTDVVKLVAALEAVEAHHQPMMVKAYDRSTISICTTCSDDIGNWEPYPCPTLAAIQEALQ